MVNGKCAEGAPLRSSTSATFSIFHLPFAIRRALLFVAVEVVIAGQELAVGAGTEEEILVTGRHPGQGVLAEPVHVGSATRLRAAPRVSSLSMVLLTSTAPSGQRCPSLRTAKA